MERWFCSVKVCTQHGGGRAWWEEIVGCGDEDVGGRGGVRVTWTEWPKASERRAGEFEWMAPPLCFSQSVAAFDGDNTSRHSKRRQQWSPHEEATKREIQWAGPAGPGIWFWV